MGLILVILDIIFISSNIIIGVISKDLGGIDQVVKPSDLVMFHLPIWARYYDISFKRRENDDKLEY